jgi:hypothetical protein
LAWNILALCADFFVLGGSIVQVGGKFWIRHVSQRKDFASTMPAGGTRVDLHATSDNLDVFSFLSIGVGSVYFILGDFGISSSSTLLLGLCLVETTILLVVGFGTYSVVGENDMEVWKYHVWPVWFIPFIGAFMGTFMMAFVVTVASFAFGALDWQTSLPLLLVSVALAAYLAKSLDLTRVREKPWQPRTFAG